MQFTLSDREREIQARGAKLVEQLIPLELAVDEANDHVSDELELAIRTTFLESGLFAPICRLIGAGPASHWLSRWFSKNRLAV